MKCIHFVTFITAAVLLTIIELTFCQFHTVHEQEQQISQQWVWVNLYYRWDHIYVTRNSLHTYAYIRMCGMNQLLYVINMYIQCYTYTKLSEHRNKCLRRHFFYFLESEWRSKYIHTTANWWQPRRGNVRLFQLLYKHPRKVIILNYVAIYLSLWLLICIVSLLHWYVSAKLV